MKPDGVQIVRGDLVRAADQILDVVVLGVQVPAGQRIGATRCEHPDEPRRELRGRPRQRRRRMRSVIAVRTSPGLIRKTTIPSGESIAAISSLNRPSAALLGPYAASLEIVAFVTGR